MGAMVSYKKYGYIKRREHKVSALCSLFPIPDPEKYPLIERLFELARAGTSTVDIAKKLAAEFPHVRPRL